MAFAFAKRMTAWVLAYQGSALLAQRPGQRRGHPALSEVDPSTMESRVAPGTVPHIGELLDVYGDCGGYNLHWAWLTGRLAGLAAAREQS